MKAGTKVRVFGNRARDGVSAWRREATTATVIRWHPVSGKREEVPGYERVKFDADGAILLVHESYLATAN